MLRRIRWWEHTVFLGGTAVRAVDVPSGDLLCTTPIEGAKEAPYVRVSAPARKRRGLLWASTLPWEGLLDAAFAAEEVDSLLQ